MFDLFLPFFVDQSSFVELLVAHLCRESFPSFVIMLFHYNYTRIRHWFVFSSLKFCFEFTDNLENYVFISCRVLGFMRQVRDYSILLLHTKIIRGIYIYI